MSGRLSCSVYLLIITTGHFCCLLWFSACIESLVRTFMCESVWHLFCVRLWVYVSTLPFFCIWGILVVAWWTGSPLIVTHPRVAGRKRYCVTASVLLDLVLLFFSSFSDFVPLFLSDLGTTLSLPCFCHIFSPFVSHLIYSHLGWQGHLAGRLTDCIGLFEQPMDRVAG